MLKDFYLNDRSTAAYFEKDWYDQLPRPEIATKFEFSPFAPTLLYSPSHQQLVSLIGQAFVRAGTHPHRVLEIGSSLGRTFYELCQRFQTIESAQLFEPSQNLWRLFNTIFVWPEPVRVQVIKGNADLHTIEFATTHIRKACAHIKWSCENQPYQNWHSKQDEFDLVVCANVIDQCHDPEKLVSLLKQATQPGGLLALSCTYQWQNRYIGNATKPIRDIQDLFNPNWKLLAEENIPFEFRVNERHWMKFLSHTCVWQKAPCAD